MGNAGKRFERAKGRKYEGRFLGVGFNILDSPAFVTLPPLGRALYFDLRRQLKGVVNNGLIAATETELDRYGWPRSTVKKYLPMLVERGLMEKTRQGGIAYMSKICSLYGFTDYPIVDAPTKRIEGKPATLAFRDWKPDVVETLRPP
jgi:hypothetical protein